MTRFVPPSGAETDTPAEAYWRSLDWRAQGAARAEWLREPRGFTSAIELAYHVLPLVRVQL